MTRGELEGKRDSIEQQRKLLDANPAAPDYARKRDRMTEELRRVGDELEKLRTSGGATAQPSAYGGVPGAGGPLIQRVGFGGSGGGFGGVRPGLGGFGAPLPTMGGGYGGGGGAGGSTGGGFTGNGGVPRGPSAGGSSSSGPLPMGRDVGSAPGISARDMRNINPEIAAYIRNSAARHGIDPNVALRIANSEGLRGSTPTHMTPGDKGTSFGPFQLHYKSRVPGLTLGGLGDAYTRETGHHASDAQHWKEQIDFAMKNARRSGWGAWHGRIGARVGVWDGIGTYNGPVPSADAGQVADRSAPSASEGSGSVGLDGQVGVDLGNGTMRMPNGRIRSKTNGAGPGPSADAAGSSGRMGDRMMQRMYGDQAPVAKGGKGSLDITLHGFPAGAKPRASMDDLFKEVNVSKSRQMETTSI